MAQNAPQKAPGDPKSAPGGHRRTTRARTTREIYCRTTRTRRTPENSLHQRGATARPSDHGKREGFTVEPPDHGKREGFTAGPPDDGKRDRFTAGPPDQGKRERFFAGPPEHGKRERLIVVPPDKKRSNAGDTPLKQQLLLNPLSVSSVARFRAWRGALGGLFLGLFGWRFPALKELKTRKTHGFALPGARKKREKRAPGTS